MAMRQKVAVLHQELDALVVAAENEREERLRGLQLAARSLRQAESTAQWVQILADAAAPLSESICFFRVEGNRLRCEAARGMDPIGEDVPLAAAPAFRQAVDTRERVVSLFRASQVSAAVAKGSEDSRLRVHLFPLSGRTRVLGVLMAVDRNGPDVFSLEVLMELGAASLDLRETGRTSTIGSSGPPRTEWRPPAAQYARSAVARLIVEQTDALAEGRRQRDIYGVMQAPIDAARREFAARYLPGPDCLHDELVARLAEGDAGALGAGYPGGSGRSGNA